MPDVRTEKMRRTLLEEMRQQRIDASGPYHQPMLCPSCGQLVATYEAYTDGRGGGPWHRLCIPPKATNLRK